jgi:hypothetical protein
MAKKPTPLAAELRAVPEVEIDKVELLHRRLASIVSDARGLIVDIDKHLKDDDRERQHFQAARNLLQDATYAIGQQYLRAEMRI